MKLESGFTLIEVLVAIVIIAGTLLGPVTLLATSFIRNEEATAKLTALYLADEGMEFVRRIRNNNYLRIDPDWRDCLSNGDYEIDYNDLSLDFPVDGGGNPIPPLQCPQLFVGIPLRLDLDTGVYSYDDSVNKIITKYTRKISITTPTDADPPIGDANDPQLLANRFEATVAVSWQDRGGGPQKSVTMQERFYNWNQQ